jgi:dTDP-4-dehydrorhamnose reductase
MKIILAGGRGLLGRNIAPLLERLSDLTILDIEEWDISDREQGREVLNAYKPDALINLAAVTDVDGCEDQCDLATKVNAEAPGVLGAICHARGVKLLHLSTDYVFDGRQCSPYTEKDKPNPLSQYGATKLEGEQRLLRESPSAVVIRTQWLYGRGGANFISKITAAAGERGSLEVVNDQHGAPTFARDLAAPILALLERRCTGIYHVANSGSCTWFQFALEVFSQLGMKVEVKPITSDRLQRKAVRPANSVFDCSRLFADTGLSMRPWQEALREYLSEGK